MTPIPVTIPYTYEQTDEAGVAVASVDLIIEAIVSSFGRPAQTYGPAERCHDAEPPIVYRARVWLDLGGGERQALSLVTHDGARLIAIADVVVEERQDEILAEAGEIAQSHADDAAEARGALLREDWL